MRWRMALTAVLALGLLSSGCSDGDDGDGDGAAEEPVVTTTTTEPDGPAAQLDGPLTGGNGINLVGTRMPDLAAAGYVEEELTAAGTATSYGASGDLPADGRWELEPADTADYRTRIVVRRPGDATDFNGTVVVEWLNVSAGFDAQPDFSYLSDELLRGGYAWVGVSAQMVGVVGGRSAVGITAGPTGGLVGADPARYGELQHPGDAFAYDIFTQIGRALRAGEGLGALAPERVLAVGESQSAFMLTTYVNGVQPLTRTYDGFLIHSRGGSAAPLGEPGAGIDIGQAIVGEPTRIRTDLGAPVIVLQSETDVIGVLGYHPARQPDSERFRLWEVAGTAHADEYLIGAGLAEALDCGGPINAGPLHLVAKAALRHLDDWVRTGEAPPEAPRLESTEAGGAPAYVKDEVGNTLGGIRTPHVDVPVSVLSGDARPGASVICNLMGRTDPLPPERLRELYGSRDEYLQRWEQATDEAIAAGFVLEDDRAALLAEAKPDAIP